MKKESVKMNRVEKREKEKEDRGLTLANEINKDPAWVIV
jgi:hypothetical protein